MSILREKSVVLELLRQADCQERPLLCPNAETPEEMEGLLTAAEAYRRRAGLDRFGIGVGITATYPEHAQLALLSFSPDPSPEELQTAARLWLGWLDLIAEQSRFGCLDAIPFLDHGWAVHAADCELMSQTWFQEAMGIIMFDASPCDVDENARLTAEFVMEAGDRVVVEACPDKVYEQGQVEKLGLTAEALLSNPEAVERFVDETGVDLVVPNLGTEHRSASEEPLHYRGDLAQEIRRRIGPKQALHGTSSLGGNVGSVGGDGICKINYYTAMAREASASLRCAWHSEPERLPISASCGAFVYRTRREAVVRNLTRFFHHLYPA